MTIEIPRELEPLLKAAAGKAGLDPTHFTQQLIRQSLQQGVSTAPSLSVEEGILLKAITDGPSAEEMDRYRGLIRKRQAETITPEEFQELRSFTNHLEKLQVRRLEHLTRLAELRGITVGELITELQIQPPDVV